MKATAIGTGRAVEVLHDRGPAAKSNRWTGGSGYLIGSRLVLTAAHNVDYRRDLGHDEQLLVRTIEGSELAALVVLVCDEPSGIDLALLEISDPPSDENLPPVTFARVDRDSPVPVRDCWAVGFPRFGEAGPVLPEGSRKETWHVRGEILPGGKLRARLLSLPVTSTPLPLPTSLPGSEWEGMSGAVVFATESDDGELAVGVVTTHHRPEGESTLTVVPITAVAELATAVEWWQQLGVADPDGLPTLPRRRGQPRWVLAASSAGWPLAEVRDPFALEVHRPVQPDDPHDDLPMLPEYVQREHDVELGRVVQAAAGSSSGIAVLVGGSSTGKTRACWEGLQPLRDRPGPWRLWHPIDPTRPDAALRELPGIGPRTVVWLNEAQFYLDVAEAGLGERVAAGLRELLRDPARAPVLVLATLWPQFWDSLTTRPADGPDPHAQARELLVGHDITVPAAFTQAQLQRLAEAGDARLVQAAAAAQDGQVIQFLAGAPELLARYRNAPPAAAALIHAAMDARRLGMGIGLPQAFLAAAAPGYLTDTDWDALGEDWLEQALAYTAAWCKGVRGPLTRIRRRPAPSRPPGPGSGDSDEQLAGGPASTAGMPLQRLADYLDQHGRHRNGQLPPAGFWAAAAGHAFPADQAALGDAAHARGLYHDAAQLHKNAAARGNLDAVLYLSSPPDCLRGDARPVRWAIAHVSLEDPLAVARLLDSLREAGAREQVTVLLARDPAAHVSLEDPGAVAALLNSLSMAGAWEQANALADRAAARAAARAPLEDPLAVARLLHRLRQKQAAALLARDPAAHVSLENPGAVAALLDSLREAGAHKQAAALADRAAAHVSLEDPGAVAALLGRLRQAGAHKQAAALADRAAAHVSLEDPGAVAELLDSLREAGAHKQAAALADRAAAHVSLKDPGAVARLLGSLRAADAHKQAAALAARAAAHAPLHDPGAVARLLGRLRQADAREQAAALLARDPAAHVSLENPGAVAALLGRLRQAGAQQQAAALAARAAAHISLEDPFAVARLLDGLRQAGAREQVTALADRAAAHISLEDPGAVAALLGRLRQAGAREQAAALADRAAARADARAAARFSPEDPGAVAELLDGLREAGALARAAALADRAAAHVSLEDPFAVAALLDGLRANAMDQQVAMLLARDPAAHAPLEDPGAVAALLGRLRAAGAREQAAALLARDPAAHVSLGDMGAVAALLGGLREAGALARAAALADRAAAHVSLEDPFAVAALLGGLRQAGAREQAAALADRAAAHVSLEDPFAVAELLDGLRETAMDQQVTVLAGRLPAAGLFELFREQEDRQDRFRFGREADGSPAGPWGWEDLD